jgi:hypothetical protein
MGAGMDDLALRYLTLALRIGRHVPGYIDGYSGSPELREAIDGEAPAPPAELHSEAVALRQLVADLPDPPPSAAWRRPWLEGQLTAMSAVCRHLDGEEIAYVDLVEALYDISADPVPEDAFRAAHRMLDDALPRGGSLAERLGSQDAAVRVPTDQVLPAIRAVAEQLRRRTRQDLWLPDGESVAWEEARDVPWGAYARYEGGLRTRIEVNIDLPLGLPGIVYLAAHEAYPGHHAERACKEAVLVGEREIGEARVSCLFTPEIAMSEGMADLAREVLVADGELGSVFRRLARQLGMGVDPAALEREARIARARELLRGASVNAALKLFHEGLPQREVRAWLAEVGLQSPARVDHELRTLRDPLWSTSPFTYRIGPTLLAEWLEVKGQTVGFARLLTEPLSPRQVRAELGDRPRPYPAGFA